MANNKELPKISILIPCRNEEDYIANCIQAILDSDYPEEKKEIIVADGESDDNTLIIAKEFESNHRSVKVFNNPKKILAAGWNIGIRNSTGDILIAANAHAMIESSHLIECVENLDNTDADCVGPALVTHPQDKNLLGKSIATMMSHPFGVGDSTFRTGTSSEEPVWVDTLHLGAYKKEVFEKIGLYNEELTRSQDKELHNRLLKFGFKMLLVPTMKVHYYTRSNPKGFFQYGFLNGYWVSKPWSLGTSIASLRHLVPMFFVITLILSFSFSFINFFLIFIFFTALISYLSLVVIASLHVVSQKKDIRYLITMPLVFCTYHITYGLGTTYGAILSIFSKRAWGLITNK
ncbi:MAG: glycosyl transferase [Candidatus Marinimicrobia bacterium]|jgi:glycosyltransferase involved in cell wall biosynthesis|nr:glycosyl transferase [Candidatus Neomarinimicrobiota bacterium]|tara:strand:- start:2040 stop:3083 length:1044 start_codon:yes stop_codon:yes gene_type:complete